MFGHHKDEQLIARALTGSQRDWTRLVRRHETRVYNQALRMTGNGADAMDLLQDVFLAAYRNLPNYRAEGVFPAWLSRIASNRINDFLRRRQRQPASSELGLEGLEGPNNPERDVAVNQRNRDILALLATLPPDQRIVVELKFFQQCTFEEIAQHLGVSSNTAKTRLYAAIGKLRNQKEMSHAL